MLRTTLGRVTIITVVMATFCMGLFFIAAWSVNDALYYEPTLKVGVVTTDGVSATSYLIFDQISGTEIASKDSTKVLPIASVTKLLTAAMFYKDIDLEATTSITWADLNTEGDAGRLRYGNEYSYRELLFPVLLESSNDAAAALLRVKPDLLEKMNAYAASLGLTSTHFSDTSGLGENTSTAYELFMLARTLYEHDPHIFDITRLNQYVGTHTGWMNNNPLVHEEGYRGGKHGYTNLAGRTDVAFFEETLATGQKRTIGYVLLGSEHIQEDIDLLRAQVREKVRFE
jgi:serine-type D-Ala-D-Ala endopeptidase (penicillin-binding protein 7)